MDPAEPEAIAHHAGLLMTHDPGDPGFAASARRFAELHRLLVPERGVADSVQGEIIRSVDRLAGEDRRNGNVNWDDGYYEDMVRYLREQLASARCFEHPVRARIAQDLDIVQRNGCGELNAEEAADPAFGRLIQDALAFAAANPQPIPRAGEAAAAAPAAGATGRTRLQQVVWLAWSVGTAAIVLSWMHVVSSTVGWVGFWLAVAAVGASDVAKRYARRTQ